MVRRSLRPQLRNTLPILQVGRGCKSRCGTFWVHWLALDRLWMAGVWYDSAMLSASEHFLQCVRSSMYVYAPIVAAIVPEAMLLSQLVLDRPHDPTCQTQILKT